MGLAPTPRKTTRPSLLMHSAPESCVVVIAYRSKGGDQVAVS
jgi:hypothetical protein